MSYRAGIGGRLAGGRPTEPHIVCDRCGCIRSVYQSKQSFRPAKWLLEGRAAPGWSGGRKDDGFRFDLCPECRNSSDKEGKT